MLAPVSELPAVTDATFDAEVLKAGRPVVVDFWAPWCGPCRAVAPIMQELEAAHGDRVGFVKLNIDENPQTASDYGVLSIPTVILFDGGQAKETIVGARPRKHFEQALGLAA
jgi:thioredoxin 1